MGTVLVDYLIFVKQHKILKFWYNFGNILKFIFFWQKISNIQNIENEIFLFHDMYEIKSVKTSLLLKMQLLPKLVIYWNITK